MSNEITVQPVAGVRANGDSAVEVKQAPASPPPLPVSPSAPTSLPNPNLRLDPALGLVVIEFRNNTSDALTTSIPSQRQLEAYQRWEQTHSGRAPRAGAPGPPAAEPGAAHHPTESIEEPTAQRKDGQPATARSDATKQSRSKGA